MIMGSHGKTKKTDSKNDPQKKQRTIVDIVVITTVATIRIFIISN